MLLLDQLEVRDYTLGRLNVHTVLTDKYKTNTFILMVKAPLEEENVSMRALLPQLLQNGTKTHPSRQQLREKLDQMYGATFTTDVQKRGEHHVIMLRLEVANERYVSENVSLFKDALLLLSEIVLQPNMEKDLFLQPVVHNEKRSLIQRIHSIYDDKMRYANVRLTEEMCKGEPYALTAYGSVEQIEAITPEQISAYYEDMLQTNDFDLYIVGDFNEEAAISFTTNAFSSLKEKKKHLPSHKNTTKTIENVNVVYEEQEINQGKLHIGFRTYTTFKDDDYIALQLFNGLFGGFSHSKLFLNVREKESLAYYAASRLESHKGLMIVMAGIEFEQYERALSIIKEQFEAMKNGQFTEKEIDQTKAMIKNQLLETADVARGFVELSYHQIVSEHSRPISDWLAQIDEVTKEAIVQVANKIQLDTVYFLKGEEV